MLDAWVEVTGPTARRLGLVTLTLAPGQTLTRALTQRVPAHAPPGAYDYAVRVGRYPGDAWRWPVISAGRFPFVKADGSARREGAEGSAGGLDGERLGGRPGGAVGIGADGAAGGDAEPLARRSGGRAHAHRGG
jgi:hypothetical protein